VCPRNQPVWVPNDNFESVGRDPDVERYLRTGVYHQFSVSERKQDYRTVWSMVYHPGQLYDNHPASLLAGGYRLFGAKQGKGDYIIRQTNQDQCTTSPEVVELSKLLAERLRPYLDCKEHEEEVVLSALITHPKKAIRMSAAKMMKEKGALYYAQSKTSTMQVKKFEWMKDGKSPRIIINLGIEAAMLGSYMLSRYKHMLEEPITTPFLDLRFIPNPSIQRLTTTFQDVMDNKKSVVARCFSDDATLSFRCNTGIVMLNMDLVQCDASVGTPLFEFFRDTFSGNSRVVAENLIKQCVSPIIVPNPHRPHERFKIRPRRHVMYSGSVCTTAIDTLANFIIFSKFAQQHSLLHTKEEALERLENCAYQCGFLVEVTICERYNELQFLKHSPAFDKQGNLTSILNIGVILRMLGQCVGDVVGRRTKTLEQRCLEFDAGLVAGLIHSGDHELLTILRAKYPRARPRYNSYIVKTESGTTSPVGGEEVYSRYGLAEVEYLELLSALRERRFGAVIRTPASDKILALDYGYNYAKSPP